MPRVKTFGIGGSRVSARRAESGDEEILRWCREVVSRVGVLEAEMSARSDGDLLGMTGSFRARLARGEPLDALLPEAFAAAREAASRTLGQRPFDVQVMGAAALHRGMIAEMRTGEGKTLTGALAAYLNALPGVGVHVLTANDYLARRDREWMAPVFGFLGLQTGLLDAAYRYPEESGIRIAAYAADVTYGPWDQFGYDYLRDNMAWSPGECVQRGLGCAIVDEADLILVDEMRSPMLIAGPGDRPDARIADCARIVAGLMTGVHYEVDERGRTVMLTDAGAHHLEGVFGVVNLYDQSSTVLLRHVHNALTARGFYRRDREYLVAGGNIVPIDTASGRPNAGRRFGDGIHQAIEAKEGLRVSSENKTLARIVVRHYLGLYERIAGMTGTAMTDGATYSKVYQLAVVPIPTNRPMIRVDHPDVVFPARQAKLAALTGDAAIRHTADQPVLIGAVSISESSEISRLLAARGIDHQVLTARNHPSEALVMAEAARLGAVTVVAQMAGRGVDIVLGGADGAEREAVCDVGGLCVLGTERSQNRRLELHLRGRAGRQGDPGESRFYLSFDDDLVKAVVSAKARSMAARMVQHGAPFNRLSLALDGAQRDYAVRQAPWLADLLEYDAVLAAQQDEIFAERRQVRDRPDVSDRIRAVIDEVAREQVARAVKTQRSGSQLHSALRKLYPAGLPPAELDTRGPADSLPDRVAADAQDAYVSKEAELGKSTLRQLERKVLLSVTDTAWRDHLQEMDALREGIGLRAFGGRSPLAEYQREGAILFARLRLQIKVRTVAGVFNLTRGATGPCG
jgi:preprotein translocase subunit SecA